MKVAIGLFGEYSDWYKYNNYHGDLFSYSFDTHSDSIFVKTEVTTGIENIPKEHQSYFNSVVHMHCISQCKRMIACYEQETGVKYDLLIFAYFNDIIWDLPTTPGEFVTHCASYSKYFLSNRLNSTQIISDYCIRQNGESIRHLYDLDRTERSKLLYKLFEDKVCDLEYFTPKTETNIFLIPSVIYTSDKPFNYTKVRSVFSPRERLEQTLLQVETLHSVDNSVSVILEGSKIGLQDMKRLSKYSYVVLFATDNLGSFYANVHWNKSSYEIYVLRKLYPLVDGEWIFKFGGRYHLSGEFNVDVFQRDKPVFKVIDKKYTYSNTDIIECVLYSIPKSFKQKYLDVFTKILEVTDRSGDSIENLLLEHSDDFYTVEHLYIIGKDAIESFNRLI
jgi:hypothetical protein